MLQGSTAISSSDLFGDSTDHSSIDLTSDLINRLSFQVGFATPLLFQVHLYYSWPDWEIYRNVIFCCPSKCSFFPLALFLTQLNYRLLHYFCIDAGWLFPILFQAQQDISSLKNIAGETGKKLSSLASTLITDLQDRIVWC